MKTVGKKKKEMTQRERSALYKQYSELLHYQRLVLMALLHQSKSCYQKKVTVVSRGIKYSTSTFPQTIVYIISEKALTMFWQANIVDQSRTMMRGVTTLTDYKKKRVQMVISTKQDTLETCYQSPYQLSLCQKGWAEWERKQRLKDSIGSTFPSL